MLNFEPDNVRFDEFQWLSLLLPLPKPTSGILYEHCYDQITMSGPPRLTSLLPSYNMQTFSCVEALISDAHTILATLNLTQQAGSQYLLTN